MVIRMGFLFEFLTTLLGFGVLRQMETGSELFPCCRRQRSRQTDEISKGNL